VGLKGDPFSKTDSSKANPSMELHIAGATATPAWNRSPECPIEVHLFPETLLKNPAFSADELTLKLQNGSV
jgi:hypothetical protein